MDKFVEEEKDQDICYDDEEDSAGRDETIMSDVDSLHLLDQPGHIVEGNEEEIKENRQRCEGQLSKPWCEGYFNEDESEENANDSELVKRLNKQRQRAIAAVHRGGKTIASRNSYKDKGGRSSHNSKIQKQLSSRYCTWKNSAAYRGWRKRDCGRPPIPRKDPGAKPEEEPLLSNHPYVDKLWQIHVAEQMILDDLEANPEKYQNQKLSELVDDDYDEEKSVEYTKAYYKKSLIPKVILKTSVRELDLEAALAEREFHKKMRKEAERGEAYKISKFRRNIEMDEYDLMHWRRSFEEREALIRDISCRQALGLPLEEPGRYVDSGYFGKDQYDPSNPLYRYDYWGEPENSEKSKQQRMTDAHNKSMVGKGVVWYEMSYEDAIKQKMQREAASKGVMQKDFEDQDSDKDDEDDDDEDFDYSILGNPSISFENQPLVNGTESSRISDEGMFED
ncbi:hypothetical protein ACJRO7_021655 [Eucalyptus globulus]|uniref:Uncharacterized protein n=1 Tax=Eucalyptus globulus TaxID=34317 RepID=A0ABD3KRT0_EUCGL